MTVLSLPWVERQRDGEEREETSPERGKTTLGGRWSIPPSALPACDHLHLHRSIPIPRRNARAKGHICETDIQGVSKLYRESVPKERRWRHFTKVRESMTKTEKKEKENGKLSYYKIDHVAVDSPGVGGGDCPIPFLNPLTKLRKGSSNQSSAPDGVSTVLARVRGLVSESSSSGSRCRFLPPMDRAAASTAVASVEATDSGKGFSDLSERLGLISEILVSVPSCRGGLSYAELKTQSLC